MKKLVMVFLMMILSASVLHAEKSAGYPYKILKSNIQLPHKASFDVQVDVVEGKLPSKEELAAISNSLKSDASKTFVMFYLPGMVVDSGAFATANHDPDLKVKINTFMVPDKYDKYMKQYE